MNEILYPYLFATIVTVAVLVASWFAFVKNQREAADHQLKAQRLPDFVRYVKLNEEIEELEARREQLRQVLSQAEGTVSEADEARIFLQQNADVIEQARRALEQMKKTESELVTLQEQIGILKEEQRKATEALSTATFERGEQERRADLLRKEREELDRAILALRQRSEALETEKATLMREAATLVERAGGLRAEVSGLEARKSQLKQELEQLDDRAASARSVLTQLTAQTQSLEGLRARLQGELGPEHVSDDKEKLEDLREPLIDPKHWPSPTNFTDEGTAINTVAQHLKSQGLKFSQRVLYAFHTALKVQGESPLLVLAGISGTGKSLLPQRYAAAMGIHCHVVPVQPRWDGPQDLLGFYHHLEQRFKATPLTRGLVQFDRFSGIHKDAYDLSGQMLLIVLDEMNLARVEYYFSEFLSRLETRRDVNLDDSVARARAAVQLELGVRDGSNHMFDLLVDRNVMFVGTINEDESTQTLSDKVVDRANVLRFGRPKELVRPADANLPWEDPTKGYLPWRTWQQWLDTAAPLSEKHFESVKNIAAQLNAAMNGIGRAFGHRTFRAMLAYATQYPLRTDQGINQALADQVEQRILPKLRGLDPTEKAASRAVSDVLEVVHALGDQELENAIDQGRDGHSFHWQGVDRVD